MKSWIPVLTAAPLLLLGALACSPALPDRASPPKEIPPTLTRSDHIDVAASDFAFAARRTRSATGTVDFVITNVGQTKHEFVIVPVTNGRYGLPIGEVEAFAPGETRALRTDLAEGKYEFVCLLVSGPSSAAEVSVASHLSKGMRLGFEVSN